MIAFNLLPWRQYRKEYIKKIFMLWLLVATVMVAISLVFIKLHIDKLTDHQQADYTTLQNKIFLLNNKIKTIKNWQKIIKKINLKINFLCHLQKQRLLVINLLNELEKLIINMHIIKISVKNNSIELHGHAKFNNDIYKIINKMEYNNLICKPQLIAIKRVALLKCDTNYIFNIHSSFCKYI